MTDAEKAARAAGIREAAEVARTVAEQYVGYMSRIERAILTLLDDAPAPAGVTVPDELYQAAKRDAEEAEAFAAELEAKLVETICLARNAINGLVDSGDAFEVLNATLQEIKGEKDE